MENEDGCTGKDRLGETQRLMKWADEERKDAIKIAFWALVVILLCIMICVMIDSCIPLITREESITTEPRLATIAEMEDNRRVYELEKRVAVLEVWAASLDHDTTTTTTKALLWD